MPRFRIASFMGVFLSAVVPSSATGYGIEGNNEDVACEEPANPEMKAIFVADQSVRASLEAHGGWDAVKHDQRFLEKWASEDSARLERTQQLLESNALKSGADFYRAAFIFQHGSEPEHFLRAHHLAVIALSKGCDARWISAATLDRFLQSVGRKQIYGTQYTVTSDGAATRNLVDSSIVSDSERDLLAVAALNQKE